MTKDKTYKGIKKEIRKVLRKINHQFDTDDWLEPGRYHAELVYFNCTRSIDQSYPTTNKGIPFYFYEAVMFVELIDRYSPINNLVVRYDGWSANSLDNTGASISTSGHGWAINSWLQLCTCGHIMDSPPSVDTNMFRHNPSHSDLSKSELDYFANVLKEYLSNTNTKEYEMGSKNRFEEQFVLGYSFRQKYLVADSKGDLLYGVVGKRFISHFLCKKKNLGNEYYLLIRDPRRAQSTNHSIQAHGSPYNFMRSIYFRNKAELFKFIDKLGEEKDQLELLLALKGIFRND